MSDGGRLSYLPGRPVVAVRHVRLDGETLLSPGDRVPDWCQEHHVLGLFRRGAVGMEGCPWVEHQLRWQGVATRAPEPALALMGELEASEFEG